MADHTHLEDEPPELPARAVAVLDGSTFLVTDDAGDVAVGSVGGLFHRDTRHLSTFVLTVDGGTLRPVSVAQSDHHAASLFLTNGGTQSVAAHLLSVRRDRRIALGLREDVRIRSRSSHTLRFVVAVRLGADFADLFEVKDDAVSEEGDVEVAVRDGGRAVAFAYRDDAFEAVTTIRLDRPGTVHGTTVSFPVELAPGGSWRVSLRVRWWDEPSPGAGVRPDVPLREDQRARLRSLRRWHERAPRLDAGWGELERIYRASLADLEALRLCPEVGGVRHEVPAAGMPWFMALFGRDSLLTSYEMIPVAPQLARGTLAALAGLQGGTRGCLPR